MTRLQAALIAGLTMQLALVPRLEAAQELLSYVVENDTIARPLTGRMGDAERGKRLMQERQKSLCLLCHTGPFPDPHLHGTLAPDLSGTARRLSVAQIRLRIVDMKRLNPATIMPSYYVIVDDDRRVGAAWHGKPVLTAEEIEDLVAYLATLKD